MDVGFLGLGAMGSVMARNLVQAGHHVRAWNRSGCLAKRLVLSRFRRRRMLFELTSCSPCCPTTSRSARCY